MNEIAPRKGATDDSTGRDLWQNRPVETSWPEGSSSFYPFSPDGLSVSLNASRLIIRRIGAGDVRLRPAKPDLCPAKSGLQTTSSRPAVRGADNAELCSDNAELGSDHAARCNDPSGGSFSCGAVVLEHDRARVSGGWAEARTAKRSERKPGLQGAQRSERPASFRPGSEREGFGKSGDGV